MTTKRPKLSPMPGLSASETLPSPPTKLMINHGKPNFTINRSKGKSEPPKPATCPAVPKVVLKSTAFNAFGEKPMIVDTSTENELEKVVLRRTKLPESNGRIGQDEDELEFVKAQRRIAERLAKETNLDFESRKSGYFTHVMMSPTSPTKSMEIPIIEKTKVQKAEVLDVISVNGTDKPTEQNTIENGQAAIHEARENGQITEEDSKEIVEAAKNLVEEVTRKAPEMVANGFTNTEQGVLTNAEDKQPISQDYNFEPKPLTSFSKELATEPNNYPDTVKVVEEAELSAKDSELLEEMSKLKFDIEATNEDDIKVIPVLREEN